MRFSGSQLNGRHSCDFAIIYYPTDNTDDGYM